MNPDLILWGSVSLLVTSSFSIGWLLRGNHKLENRKLVHDQRMLIRFWEKKYVELATEYRSIERSLKRLNARYTADSGDEWKNGGRMDMDGGGWQ